MALRSVGIGVALAATAVLPAVCGAQQGSQSASVIVSLRILPHASFEGGAEQPISAAIAPGAALDVLPARGVRTRMTYNAPTTVVVSGTPLRGPGGATLPVRFVCAFGDGLSVSAAEPFDCVGGHLAALEGGRVTSIPLAVGARLSAVETAGVPPGEYTGVVTLTATYRGY
jgi:hypothetical protein